MYGTTVHSPPVGPVTSHRAEPASVLYIIIWQLDVHNLIKSSARPVWQYDLVYVSFKLLDFTSNKFSFSTQIQSIIHSYYC